MTAATELQTAQNTPTAISPMAFLNEDTLRFFAQMVEKANLVPYDRNMSSEAQRARVMAKIVGGSAHGFDPISSQTFLHVVNNRLELSASGIACKIKESGIYDFRIDKLDDDGCQLTALFLVSQQDGGQEWEPRGPSVTFTREMANDIVASEYKGEKTMLGEKDTYQNYGPDMFFARCATRLAKRFFPQVLRGGSWTNPVAEYQARPPVPSGDQGHSGETFGGEEQDKAAPIGSTTPKPDTPEEQHEQMIDVEVEPDAVHDAVELKAVRAMIIDYCEELGEVGPKDDITLREANAMLSRLVDMKSKKEEETKDAK